MIELRDYQLDLIERTRGALRRGVRRVLLQAPTGAGKTALTAHMIGTAASRGKRCWFVVHRRELVMQSIAAFDQVGVPHGVVAAGWQADRSQPVQVASIQTLARRLNLYERPDLVVWDECHHLAAGQWAKAQAAITGAVEIGLTATPMRLDGRGLDDHFDEIVAGPSTSQLIADGWLSPFKYYAPGRPTLDGVHSRMGDYARGELAGAMDKPQITGDAIAHYRRLCDGQRALVFACTIVHSRAVVEQFRAAGYPAEHVDGCTDSAERDAAIDRFRSGRTLILSNVDLFGEGFDLPAASAAILLRPTQSLALYLQMCGRVLRTADGKSHATILDHAGNVQRHGMPDDEREWTLAGRRGKRGGESTICVRVCEQCYTASPSGTAVCPACGFVWPVQERAIEEVEGELVEVDREALRRAARSEQGSAWSLDQLTQLGRDRGYKSPKKWAEHILRGRMNKRNDKCER